VDRTPEFRRPDVFAALVFTLCLAACGGSAPTSPQSATATPDAAAEAAGFSGPAPALMGLLTGQPFDVARGCWPMNVETEGRLRSLCFRPGTPEWRPQDGRDRVFLHAYAIPDTGMERGVFSAIVAEESVGGRWRALAQLRALPVGEDGDCACSKAGLRRMGRDRWGWVFAARDGGQRRFHVVMSSSAGLSQVARLPVPEDGIDGLRHSVEFDIRDENAEVFSLLHVTLRGVQPVDVDTYPFEGALGRYAEVPTPSG
jgi:hypothetical protein